jgi:hypothetical protein
MPARRRRPMHRRRWGGCRVDALQEPPPTAPDTRPAASVAPLASAKTRRCQQRIAATQGINAYRRQSRQIFASQAADSLCFLSGAIERDQPLFAQGNHGLARTGRFPADSRPRIPGRWKNRAGSRALPARWGRADRHPGNCSRFPCRPLTSAVSIGTLLRSGFITRFQQSGRRSRRSRNPRRSPHRPLAPRPGSRRPAPAPLRESAGRLPPHPP